MSNNSQPSPQIARANWYWTAPYIAVLVFALAMLTLVDCHVAMAIGI